jgi:hypothetical protein
MRVLARVLVLACLALGMLAAPAAASHNADAHFKMDQLFTSPNTATNSDLAFWGDHAFVGYYTGDAGSPPGTTPRGGVRIFDISNPAAPRLIKNVVCDGLQADPIVWDRNGNGVADLLMLAVDRTMESPECGAPRSNTPAGCQVTSPPTPACTANHADPDGWEGVRIFEMSDDPANPFATVRQVKGVYTDCGAHTITAWPGAIEETNKLVVYVSSYPLRPGPTCGDTEYLNTANPYDGDPGSPANPLHGVIQVLEVPLNNLAASKEIAQPEISYPGDPDGKIDWCERSIIADPNPCPGALEPAAVACHDIVVHMETGLAGAACAEQGQVWRIGPDGIPDTAHPIVVADDEFSSGGTGNIPGAVDFFHSAMFNNDGTVVNWVDESFGEGCPTMTPWRARPWHPAAVQKTGKMFFSDVDSGAFLSEFHIGDVRPDPREGEYCSAHMGMAVLGIKRDLLVNAWYTGGADVIDFSKPTRLKEVAFYDTFQQSGTWSAYPYTGPLFKTGPGIPIYASDGVENNAIAQGMVVYRAKIQKPGSHVVDHLNPQTMEK